MFALALTVTLAAAPLNARLNYERKCLYCHSEEVTERKKLSEPQWRKLIGQMRRKAPLLITRADVTPLTHYIVGTLKLGIPVRKRIDRAKPKAEPVPEPEPEPAVAEPEPAAPEPPEPSPEEAAVSEQGFALLQKRCSKCHTLSRVFRKLDSFERSFATVERMRLKTGSGITDHDLAILEEYLRAQFD